MDHTVKHHAWSAYIMQRVGQFPNKRWRKAVTTDNLLIITISEVKLNNCLRLNILTNTWHGNRWKLISIKVDIISCHVHVHINNQHIPTCIHQNQLSTDIANSQCIYYSNRLCSTFLPVGARKALVTKNTYCNNHVCWSTWFYKIYTIAGSSLPLDIQ